MTKYVKFFMLLLSAAMILLGIYSGETQIVLQKAVNICLECIGIG